MSLGTGQIFQNYIFKAKKDCLCQDVHLVDKYLLNAYNVLLYELYHPNQWPRAKIKHLDSVFYLWNSTSVDFMADTRRRQGDSDRCSFLLFGNSLHSQSEEARDRTGSIQQVP